MNEAQGHGSQLGVTGAAGVAWRAHVCMARLAPVGGAPVFRWQTSSGPPGLGALPIGHLRGGARLQHGAPRANPAQQGAMSSRKSAARSSVYMSDLACAATWVVSNSEANASHCSQDNLPSHGSVARGGGVTRGGTLP